MSVPVTLSSTMLWLQGRTLSSCAARSIGISSAANTAIAIVEINFRGFMLYSSIVALGDQGLAHSGVIGEDFCRSHEAGAGCDFRIARPCENGTMWPTAATEGN